MWYKENSRFFLEEKLSILLDYPELIFSIENDTVILSGLIEFTATYNDYPISDTYKIKIIFPDDYPQMFPICMEMDGRIPKDYHQYSNGTLCVGTKTEVMLRFSTNPNIVHYINNLLIPYLYRYSYFEKNNATPYPDYSHGAVGQIEFYFDYFAVRDMKTLGQLLFVIIESNYRGHVPCPCGSGKKTRDCHGEALQKLQKIDYYVKNEFNEITSFLQEIKNKKKEDTNELGKIIYRN